MWTRISLLLLLPAAVQAQSPVQRQQVDDSIYALAVDPADHQGHDYVVLLDDGLFRVEADGTTSYTLRQVVQILTYDGAAFWGEFQFPYEEGRERIRIDWMRVVEDGLVLREGPEHQQETSPLANPSAPVYSNFKMIQATLAGVRPGTIVDYSITQETFAPWLKGDYFYRWTVNQPNPVLRSRFVVDSPADLEARVKESNLDFAPTEVRVSGRRIRTWETQDLAPIEFEPFAPFPNDAFMWIDISGTLSWTDIGTWYIDLFQGRYELSDYLTAAHALELVDARSLEDSLKATYRWVAQDYRYVSLALGAGGYQPRLPEDVYDSGFGDCKDKSMLFIALVREMGIQAYPVLVHTEGDVDPLMPSLEHFDHMIAAVERDGRTDFLDLTASLAPYGEIPPFLQGEVGLVLRDNGEADVIVLPAAEPDSNRWDEEVVGTIDLDNRLVGSITWSASGTEQYDLRDQFSGIAELQDRERQEYLRQYATWFYETAVLDSSSVFEGRDLDTPAKVTVWFTVEDLLGQVGDQYMWFLPLTQYGSPSAVPSLEEYSNRRSPIDVAQVNSPSVYHSSVDIALPEGWSVSLPENVSVDGPFGYYRGEYRQVGRQFRATREMGGRRGLEPPDGASALVEWFKKVSEDETEYVLIDPSGTAEPDVNPHDYAVGGIADVLLTVEDLGGGVVLMPGGATDETGLLAMSGKEPIEVYSRVFAPAQMVFTFGGSQFASVSVSGGEFRTEQEAVTALRMMDLIDFGAFFEMGMAEGLGDQASVGDMRQMELPSVGSRVRGWRTEMVTPFASFDVVFAMMARGRVGLALFALGTQGLQEEDVEQLLGIIDQRIQASPKYLVDLEPDPEVEVIEDIVGLEYAGRAEGVPLGEMLPTTEDFPRSTISTASFESIDGATVFTRVLEGKAFSFTIGDTEAVSLVLNVGLFETEALALKAALLSKNLKPESLFAAALIGEEWLGSMLLSGDSSSFQDVVAPLVGGHSMAMVGRLRSAFRTDLGVIAFAAGRLTATVTVASPPGELNMDDLHPIAEEIYERMERLAPGIVAFEVQDDLFAAVERVIATEKMLDSLMTREDLDALLGAMGEVDLGSAPVGFEADTWQRICQLGVLWNRAPDVMTACETAAGLAPGWGQYSRGMARAVTGDLDGAIEDLEAVIEVAPDDSLQSWVNTLRTGENPITPQWLAIQHISLAFGLLGQDVSRAHRHLLLAVELDPEHAVAHNNLAVTYHLLEDVPNALIHAERSYSLEPTIMAADKVGSYRILMGNPELAIPWLIEAVSMSTEFGPEATRYLGGDLLSPLSLLSEGDSVAVEQNVVFSTRDQKVASLHLALGRAYGLSGDYQAGDSEFETALDLFPDANFRCLAEDGLKDLRESVEMDDRTNAWFAAKRAFLLEGIECPGG